MDWIGLTGPTASGKTAVALALARRRPIEIVSVDSALVYRGLDIGSAKPSAAERAAVPHHLIDIREPDQPYSAAAFAADATRLIADIRGRGKLALLVGGTMLYFKALIEGLDAIPAADPAVRAALQAEAAAVGWPALHARLARVDPASAARLAPADAQRISRALEVWHSSGRALSSFHSGPRTASAAPMVSLEPDSRAWLHARIGVRLDAMLAAGLLDEVRGLRGRPELHAGMSALRSVGYRQAWEAFEAGLEGAALASRVRERAGAATRQLAKRQLTWLRSMPGRRVVRCDQPDAVERAIEQVEQLIGSRR